VLFVTSNQGQQGHALPCSSRDQRVPAGGTAWRKGVLIHLATTLPPRCFLRTPCLPPASKQVGRDGAGGSAMLALFGRCRMRMTPMQKGTLPLRHLPAGSPGSRVVPCHLRPVQGKDSACPLQGGRAPSGRCLSYTPTSRSMHFTSAAWSSGSCWWATTPTRWLRSRAWSSCHPTLVP